MLPSFIRHAYTSSGVKVEPLRVGQIGGRGTAALTDRPRQRPRYLVRASGGADGRRRLIRQLCTSLILHGAIRTTLHRAKGTQRRMAAYISWAKRGTEVCRQKAMENLLVRTLAMGRVPSPAESKNIVQGSKELACDILFNELGKRFKDEPSAFTCLFELGPRPSDAALMAIIQIRGSSPDYSFHHGAMVAGRQMAINGQGYRSHPARELSNAWQRTPLRIVPARRSPAPRAGMRGAVQEALRVPVVAGNGTHLHPAYQYLPYTVRQKVVRVLRKRTAQEALEFDEMMRYHCDRTLAIAKQPGFESAADLEKASEAEQDLLDIYEDDLPYVEGEEELMNKKGRRGQPLAANQEVPSVDLVGAQIMPAEGAGSGSARDKSWMRPALSLVRGQYDGVPNTMRREPRMRVPVEKTTPRARDR